MKAVGRYRPAPIEDPASLVDLDLPDPRSGGRDLLVQVEAVSVNPADTKRRRTTPAAADDSPLVLGWDAAGTVLETGSEVSLFKPGDRVFYAGAANRPGCNSARHLVDERLVGPMPGNLGFAEAAAMPLTALTAWEMLFERFRIPQHGGAGGTGTAGGTLLVVGGAGGVGSMAIQIARQLTGLTVVATASRPETRQWCLDLGAHAVLDHSRPLAGQIGDVPYVFITTAIDQHLPVIDQVLAPQGHVGLIEVPKPFEMRPLMQKSTALHWELMFTRSLFGTADMIRQHEILTAVSGLVEAGRLRTTLTEVVGPIDAATLRRTHARIEAGRARGKLVLEGWG
ncbi:zinc-binding alcohol dehydrogenase family protein [Roseomonas hellenica]|uniref:Zinc-type alcohol dehydrogenase-like protein n=1 Tax=Plastoroseomonas hellenica TaxID=2687306 RepID=A0ABS5F862_9PROT|nr:zinc-binding alcohol dehydrogenase family protein [Plastoroseomonas hellenica]MBR0668681.1 zinc-binding alcohol dehydrogenase family protein [Plastoroseomonas hellenica]